MDFSVGRGIMKVWGVSSFGRALPWHGRGEEFEPPTLHHLLQKSPILAFFHGSEARIY